MRAEAGRGRFAPSPTGPLHFGSLVAAVGSYLDALALGSQWLVRMEDLDPPREVAGAASAILTSLERFGFEWHGEVLFQSTRLAAYRHALNQLRAQGAIYPCSCSRKDLRALVAKTEGDEPAYPGTCRSGVAKLHVPTALRVLTNARPIAFTDRLQGPQVQVLSQVGGDFIVQRKDGLAAYQLAVVVDDEYQRITHVVRGCDLLDSTPRQLYLQHLLGLPSPDYAHLPIAINAEGNKLSKQSHAAALDDAHPEPALVAALAFLGQAPPASLQRASLAEVWAWAREFWRTNRVAGSQHPAPQ